MQHGTSSCVGRNNKLRLLAGIAPLLACGWAHAFEPANSVKAGAYKKGATLNVFIPAAPGGAPAGTVAGITASAAAWTTAQAAADIKGLTLVVNGVGVTAANADVVVSFGTNLPEWGVVTRPGTQTLMQLEVGDGLTAAGIQNVAMHELGHVEGLGHSVKSALMKADAFSTTKGKAPSAADLNGAAALTPTADDLDGKKSLWGTAAPAAKADKLDKAALTGALWEYDYQIAGETGAGYADPITNFSIDLSGSIDNAAFLADFTNIQVPNGWTYTFTPGGPVGLSSDGMTLNDGDDPDEPSILSFDAISSSYGVMPGSISGQFSYDSLFAPGTTRSFTGDADYDSSEFTNTVVPAVAAVPEPAALGMIAVGSLFGLARRRQNSNAK